MKLELHGDIHIHLHTHPDHATESVLAQILKAVNINTDKLNSIKMTVEELSALADTQATQIADLQTSADATQQKVADAVKAFEDSIADLKAQIANLPTGPDSEALQAIADKFTANNAALAALKADLESTPVA